MAAFGLYSNLKVRIAFLCHAHAGQVGVQQPLYMRRQHGTALVYHAVQVHAPAFQFPRQFPGTVVAAADDLLIMPQAQVHPALWGIALLQQRLHALHQADQVVLHVQRTATPNKPAVIYAVKGRVFPVLLGALADGHHILMGQKGNRIQVGIRPLPVKQQTGSGNMIQFQIFVNQRVGLFQKRMEAVKRTPICLALILAGDGLDLNRLTEPVARPLPVHLLRREFLPLGLGRRKERCTDQRDHDKRSQQA